MGSFEPITLKDRDRISRYLRIYPDNETSEYSFTNLFIWSGVENIEWRESDGIMCLRTWAGGVLRYLMAFAPEDRFNEALDTAIATSAEAGRPFFMHSLPDWYREKMEAHMPGRFTFAREPHMDDYVYRAKDLIKLPGKKYHAKRNHINRFMNEYGGRYIYAPYEESMAGACMEIYNRWLSGQRDPAPLCGERDSVACAIANAEALGVVGGVVLIDGVPQAFSLGERLTSDMAVIHIEKANPAIHGLFSVINRDFAANAFSDAAWINREEDMGDEGMKRAKLSYRPARMIEKYRAILV